MDTIDELYFALPKDITKYIIDEYLDMKELKKTSKRLNKVVRQIKRFRNDIRKFYIINEYPYKLLRMCEEKRFYCNTHKLRFPQISLSDNQMTKIKNIFLYSSYGNRVYPRKNKLDLSRYNSQGYENNFLNYCRMNGNYLARIAYLFPMEHNETAKSIYDEPPIWESQFYYFYDACFDYYSEEPYYIFCNMAKVD